jgi:hypothetical protein
VSPALLLHVHAEIAHRQETVRADWARSRPDPRRRRAARPPVLQALTARLLHA